MAQNKSSPSSSSGGQQTIDIAQLNVQQLSQLSQQLDQEIELFSNSLSKLKMLQGKFVESQDCVSKVTTLSEGKELLVPLTSSMYVAGQLADVNNILIDIGTGYYVEKSVDDAVDYYKRKTEYLTKQMEKIQPILQEKYKMKQAVVEILQMKVQGQILAQEQAAKAK